MDLENISQRREEKRQERRNKWLCHTCVKKRIGKKGEITCQALCYEPGKLGNCWAYSDNPRFFQELKTKTARYRKRLSMKKANPKIRRD